MNSQRDQCTESVRVSYERGVISAGGGNPRAYRIVRRTRVKPEMVATYTNALKTELLPALSKDEHVRYRVRKVEWGGSPNDFVSTSDEDKLEALDGPNPVRRAMGEEKANAWFKKSIEHGTVVEAAVYLYLPEISWSAPRAALVTTK